MFILGLTGGIGSGKTAASDYFSSKGITIVDADIVSRLVVEPGQDSFKEIASHFGTGVISDDGSLNRPALRKIVFDQPKERLWLENLLHPLIANEIQTQLNTSESIYTVLVSPILFESAQNLYTQRTLVIDTPEDLQISRTAKRDNTDPDSVKAIMKVQTERQVRIEKADDVILNNGSLNDLHQNIDQLHRKYLQIAQEKS